MNHQVILPVSYLPAIDQYCYLVQCNKILFEVNETYPKQTCRNRTVILTANGLLRLTVPVIKPYGNKTKTSEIVIDNKSSWRKIHWKAITSAYNKSPFFLYYKDELEHILLKADGSLIDFNLSLITQINKFLKIKPEMEYTSEFIKEYQTVIDKRDCPKDSQLADHQFNRYTQVFSDRFPFISNLSIIDLLFNEGPQAVNYLRSISL